MEEKVGVRRTDGERRREMEKKGEFRKEMYRVAERRRAKKKDIDGETKRD
jgi:hypothetical protein